MNTANQTRSSVMIQAWDLFRMRSLPGSTIRTFSDALRAAWRWIKGAAQRAAAATAWAATAQQVVRLRSMVTSPIARALTGQSFAHSRDRAASYITSRLGC